MEPKVPLSAVMRLIEQQNTFNTLLIDKLGLYLVQAAEKYERALNPPMDTSHDGEMTATRWNEDEEDLRYQIEAGIIPQNQVSDAMRRLLGDTDVVVEIP